MDVFGLPSYMVPPGVGWDGGGGESRASFLHGPPRVGWDSGEGEGVGLPSCMVPLGRGGMVGEGE